MLAATVEASATPPTGHTQTPYGASMEPTMARKHRSPRFVMTQRCGAATAPTFAFTVRGFGFALNDQDFGKLPATCESISQARTMLLNSLKSGRDVAAIVPTFVMCPEFETQLRRMAQSAGYKLTK